MFSSNFRMRIRTMQRSVKKNALLLGISTLLGALVLTTSCVALLIPIPLVGTVTAPTFSESGGDFSDARSLTISTTHAGATVYYSINNESLSSTSYDGSGLESVDLTVDRNMVIRAIAVKTPYNDSDVVTATFRIDTPDILIRKGTTDVASGTTIDLGNIVAGDSRTFTFTVINENQLSDDGVNLVLSGSPVAVVTGTGFSLNTDVGQTSLGAGATTTFTVDYDPTTDMTYTGTVSLASNDLDETPYTFTITADVTIEEQEIVVLLDTTEITNGQADVDIGSTVINESLDVIFTIENRGSFDLDLTAGPPRVTEDGAEYTIQSDASTPISPFDSTTFTLRFLPTSDGTYGATVTIASTDTDEGTFTFTVTGTGYTPEINVKQSTTDIPSGSGPFILDSVKKGTTADTVFTIESLGTGPVLLSGSPRVTVSGGTGFTLQNDAPASIANGDSDTFTVRFNNATPGDHTATITIANNDQDEGAYTFDISCISRITPIQYGTTEWDQGLGVVSNSSGTTYLTGFTKGSLEGETKIGSTTYPDAFLTSIDTNGNRTGTELIGTTSSDEGQAICITNSDLLYLCGSISGSIDSQTYNGNSDIMIRAYNTSGVYQWTRLIGSVQADDGYDIAVDGSGSIYVTGAANATISGTINPYSANSDIVVTKYNSSGIRQWVTLLGGSQYEEGHGITVDATGDVYVTGWSRSDDLGDPDVGSNDIILAKYNNLGSLQWLKKLGSTSTDVGFGVTVDNVGFIYVVGTAGEAINGQTYIGSGDFFVAKFEPDSGGMVWIKQFGTSSYDHAKAIACDSSNNLYIVGRTYGALYGQISKGFLDVHLTKIDSNGNILWVRQSGSSDDDYGLDIFIDSTDNIYMTGYTRGDFDGSRQGSLDIFMLKYDTDGNMR
jgi:hypothetical protein